MRTKSQPALIATPSPFLSSAEVRTILRCSIRTLKRMYLGDRRPDGSRVRPVLSVVRRGATVLFARTAIEAYIARRTVAA